MPTNSEQVWTVERVEEWLAKSRLPQETANAAEEIIRFLLDSLTRARQDAFDAARDAVETLNTTVPVGYTMTPRAMTIGEFRAEVMRAIDKLRDKEKG